MIDRRSLCRRWYSHVFAIAVLAASAAHAHHSYAMFDGTKTLTVAGTVAKLEWTNPHV